MTAADHSKVWENAAARLRKASDDAQTGGCYAESATFLSQAAFAAIVAVSYQEHASAVNK